MVHQHNFRYNTIHYGTVSDKTQSIVAQFEITQLIKAQFQILRSSIKHSLVFNMVHYRAVSDITWFFITQCLDIAWFIMTHSGITQFSLKQLQI